LTDMTDSKGFPIRVLSAKTGVPAPTLRAWERRYGMLQPGRTPKGHRLYTEADVAWVRRVQKLLEEGLSPRHIAALRQEGKLPGFETAQRVQTGEVWQELQESALAAVQGFNAEQLERTFSDALSLFSMERVTERLIEPVMGALGDSWDRHDGGIAEEHFFSAWLRLRLGARFHHTAGLANGPRIVCTSLPGARHEIGLLLFAINAMGRGYRILYLGADLPLEQLTAVMRCDDLDALVLSSREGLGEVSDGRLAELVLTMPVPVFLGGAACRADLSRFRNAGGRLLGEKLIPALDLLEQYLGAFVPAAPPG
jgi:DNA-binding transcriptional MerR regulator